MMEHTLKYRFTYLIVLGVFGGLIFFFLQSGYYIWDFLIIETPRTRDTVQIFISSIPVVSLLWFFRTYDTKKLIQKNEESIAMSLLAKAMDMITADSQEKKKLGLSLLAKIKQDNSNNTSLENIINFSTKHISFQGVDLSNINLEKINLSGANLSNSKDERLLSKENGNGGANREDIINNHLLKRASGYYEYKNYILSGTNLSGTNLSGADLSNAKLFGTNLSNTILCNAILCNAKLSGERSDLLYFFEPDTELNSDLINTSHASLRKSDLKGVDLNGADLRGVDLSEAKLSNIKIDGEPLSMDNLNKVILCDTNKKLLEDSILKS